MIGLFGGTFDPVHFGHLRPALDVFEALALTELRFIPLGQAVHRRQPVLPAAQRLALLEAAIAAQPGFRVDERELRSAAPSYTVETLASLRAELGDDISLCLLLGRDAFNGFLSWREPERILQLTHMVVMDRPGAEPPAGELARFAAPMTVDDPQRLRAAPAGEILFQPVTQLEISSSDIRRRLARSRSIRYLVPEAVLELLHGWQRMIITMHWQ